MRALLLAPVWLWLLVFVGAPAAILVTIALAVPAASVPPFRLGWGPGGLAGLLDGHYVSAFGRSLSGHEDRRVIAEVLDDGRSPIDGA